MPSFFPPISLWALVPEDSLSAGKILSLSLASAVMADEIRGSLHSHTMLNGLQVPAFTKHQPLMPSSQDFCHFTTNTNFSTMSHHMHSLYYHYVHD